MLSRGFYVAVNSPDALQKKIKYGIQAGLHYETSEHPLFIVEDPFSKIDQRKKLAELMFEGLDVPALYFMKSSSCIGYTLCFRAIVVSLLVKLHVFRLTLVRVEFESFLFMMDIPL